MAFRFTPGSVALATLFLSGFAVAATSLGSGPFVRDITSESLILLQAFTGLTTLMGLTLAAAVTGHKQAEAQLRQLNAVLEQRVHDRTAQLEQTVRELQQAIAEIRTLKGLIPICGWCKKIRDDRGFWQQLEAYLKLTHRSDIHARHLPRLSGKADGSVSASPRGAAIAAAPDAARRRG